MHAIKEYGKAYLVFLAMAVLTAKIVKPMAVKNDLPIIKDL